MRSFICVLLILCSGTAASTSCGETTDRIIAHCDQGVCEHLFYVKQEKISNACKTIISLMETPHWASMAIEHEIDKQAFNNAVGMFELSIRIKWFPGADIYSFGEYLSRSTDRSVRDRIRTELNHLQDWNYLQTKNHWETEAKRQLDQYERIHQQRTIRTIPMLLALACSVFLFIQGSLLRKKAYQVAAIILQFGLFAIIIQTLFSTIGVHGIWVMVFYPGILLFQVLMACCLWLNKKQASGKPKNSTLPIPR
jgi:hypothetical protein